MEITSECPYCGEEMERGYLITSQGIWWDDKRPGILWTIFGKEAIATSFGRSVVASIRCRKCGIVIIGTKPEQAKFRGIICPHCGAIYTYSEDEIDESGFITCQNCTKSFLLDQDNLEEHHEHE